MASFTQQLDLASSSRRIIDPQNNKGPTFLEGLANFGTNLVSQGSDNFRRAQAASRQQAADARTAANQQAESDAAKFVLDARSGNFQTGPRVAQPELPSIPVALDDNLPVPVDSELEGAPLPPDVTRTVTQLQRAQSAENQGRAPQGSSGIRIEAALADLRAKYPDRQDVIYKTLKDAGLDHWLFREAEAGEAVFDAQLKAETDMFQTNVKAAVDAGAVLPGTDPNEAAVIGQRILAKNAQIAENTRLRIENQALTAEGRTQSEFDQKELDREFNNTYLAKADTIITPLWNGLTSRISSAGFTDSQGNIQSLDRLIPVAQQSINQIYANLISEARSASAPQDTIQNLERDRDDKIKMIDNMLTGDASTFAVRKRSIESLQLNLKMSAMDSMKTYTGLVEVFGAGAVNEIFAAGGLNSVLPPEVLQELSGDLRNVSGVIDTPGERMTMAKISGLLRGELEIQNMTETEARKAIPSMGATHQANARSLGTNPSQANQTAYVNSGFALSNAALEIQPGADRNTFIRNVPTAQVLLFGLDQKNADLQVGDPTLILGKRAAATHLLDISKRTPLSASQIEQGWSYVYQQAGPRAGTYQITLDRRAYNNYRDRALGAANSMSAAGGGIGIIQGTIPTYERALANPPNDLRQQVGGMNYTLGYLVETTKFDETMAGVSPADARRLFALGEVPEVMRTRASEVTSQRVNQEQLDNQLIDAFTSAASQSAERSQTARQPAPEAQQAIQIGSNILSRRGWSTPAIAGILGNLQAESNFSTTVAGDGGQAIGLAQWHPDRRATAARQGFDLTDINQAFAFIDWELNNTESNAGRRLRSATDAAQAADIFAQYFLRPRGSESGNPENIHNISGRRANARRIAGG